MIVWAHGNFIAVHFIGAALIEYVGYYVDIIAAHGLTDNALCFARSKTGANGVNQISISLITCKGYGAFMLILSLRSPFDKIAVNFTAQLFTAVHSYNS